MTIGSTAFQEPNRLCDQVPTLRVSRVLDLIIQIAKSIKHSTQNFLAIRSGMGRLFIAGILFSRSLHEYEI
jgi:hypothetical protein